MFYRLQQIHDFHQAFHALFLFSDDLSNTICALWRNVGENFQTTSNLLQKRKEKTWKSIWIISEIMEKRRENLIYFSIENNFKIFFSFLNKHSNEKMQSNQEVTSVLFSSSQTQEWRREASEWMIRAFVTLCIFACCLSLGEKLLLDKHKNWTFQRFLDIFPVQILFALSLISFPFYLCLRNASSRFFSINKTTSRMQASFRFSSGTFSLSERKS